MVTKRTLLTVSILSLVQLSQAMAPKKLQAEAAQEQQARITGPITEQEFANAGLLANMVANAPVAEAIVRCLSLRELTNLRCTCKALRACN